MKYEARTETACLKELWRNVGKHPSLPSIVFAEGYWETGVDALEHIDQAKDFHGGCVKLPEWSVLDLGCGVGRQTLHLAKVAKKATGADISESLVKLARRFKNLNKQRALRYKVINGKNLKTLGSFDFIYSYQMFCLFRFEKQIVNYIKEIYNILNRGGYAQLYILTEGDPWGAALQPSTWENLVDTLNFAQADVIPETDPLDRSAWFLFEK